jgi:transmembrane sensor
MSDHQLQSIIAKEALEWFTRSRDGELSSQERVEFAAWLASSPLHVEHYLRTAAVSRDLGVAVASLDIDVDALLRAIDDSPGDKVLPLYVPQTNAVQRTGHWQHYRHRIAACLVATALLVGGYTVMVARDGQRFGLPKTFTTHAGQQLSWRLPDGSRISLNASSRVVVNYGARERLVKLESGQAFFEVAHEPERRFRVMAGDGGVIAIGTEFDVRRDSRSTEVTVVHGRVAVFTGQPPSTATLAVLSPHQVALNAGQQARIDEDAPAERPRLSVLAANIPATVAWLQHEIAFDQRSLASVADEFSRYSGVPIEIESSRLQSLPISGVFSEYDTESFLQFLAKLDDVEIQRGADRIVLIDKRR